MISNPEENIRVRTQSISALVNFLRGLVNDDSSEETDDYSDLIAPYAPQLLDLITKVFEHSLQINNRPLQEESLTTISLIATILDKDFAPYYNGIMPYLKKLFYQLHPQENDNAQKELRAQCIDTMSYLCSSLSNDDNLTSYLQDFKELCDVFAKLLVTLKAEDPEVVAVLKAYSHISTSMRKDFYPYLESLLPLLESYVNADVDFKLEDVDLEKINDDFLGKSAKPGLLFKSEGVSKKLSLKTFVMQNKVMALEVLKDVVLNMGVSFKPYLKRILALIQPLVNCVYSRKIRKISAQTFEASLYACETDTEQREIVEFVFPAFLEKLKKDIEIQMIRDVKSFMKVLSNAFSELKSTEVINQNYLESLYTLMNQAVVLIEKRKAEIKTSSSNEEGFDENDKEGFVSDINVLNEVTRRVMELSGVLFKRYRSSLTNVVSSKLLDLFFNILSNAINITKDDEEITFGLCFFTDFLNYSSEDRFRQVYPEFLKLSQSIKTTTESVIQNITFGYGIIAERTTVDEFVAYAPLISSHFTTILGRKPTDDNKETFDNAVSGIGKIMYFKSSNDQQGVDLAKRYFDFLPLKHDLEESDSVVGLLYDQLAKQNPIILNEAVRPSVKGALLRIQEFDQTEEFLSEANRSNLKDCIARLN